MSYIRIDYKNSKSSIAMDGKMLSLQFKRRGNLVMKATPEEVRGLARELNRLVDAWLVANGDKDAQL